MTALAARARGASVPAWPGSLLAVAPVAVACGSGVLLVELDMSLGATLIVLIGLVLVVPLGARSARRTLDLFEPLVVINVALLVMYVLRPAALLSKEGPHVFKGLDISELFIGTLAIAGLACVSMQTGYSLSLRHCRGPAREREIDATAIRRASAVLSAIGILGFLIFITQVGGLSTLSHLLAGRDFSHDAIFKSSTAYFYSALTLLLPASLLLWTAFFHTRQRTLAIRAVLTMVPLLIFAAGQGSRLTLMPLLVGPIVLFYLAHGRRPKPLALLIAIYLLVTVGIGYVREVRYTYERPDLVSTLSKTLKEPQAQLAAVVGGGTDNDMFESFAASRLVIGSSVEINPIDYGYRLLAKPIPSAVWPGKPTEPDEHLNDVMFPHEPIRSSNLTGLVGSFYLAGGVVGVFLGMLIAGYVCAAVWRRYCARPRDPLRQLVLVTTIVLTPMILRSGVADTLARLLFFVLPLLFVYRSCFPMRRQEERWETPVDQVQHLRGAGQAR